MSFLGLEPHYQAGAPDFSPVGPDELSSEMAGIELTDKSDLEQSFLFYINALQLPAPIREWRFHPVRRWRFDFAWPDRLVAVECEGGTWSEGRHVRGGGFENDCWKYNSAAVLGWKVLRVTGGMLDKDALDFLDLLVQALDNEDAE